MADKSRTSLMLLFLMAAAVFITPPLIHAATLVWEPSRGVVDGYIVYWGTDPGNTIDSIDVGPRAAYNLDLLPLAEGVTYYISLSAYNSAGESARCTPVVFIPGDNTPPAPPVGLMTE